MTTIDANGAKHAANGQYTEKGLDPSSTTDLKAEVTSLSDAYAVYEETHEPVDVTHLYADEIDSPDMRVLAVQGPSITDEDKFAETPSWPIQRVSSAYTIHLGSGEWGGYCNQCCAIIIGSQGSVQRASRRHPDSNGDTCFGKG